MLRYLVKKFVRNELMPLEKNILDRFAAGQPAALSDEENVKLFKQCKDLGLWALDVPEEWIHGIKRRKSLEESRVFTERALTEPEVVRQELLAMAAAMLPVRIVWPRMLTPSRSSIAVSDCLVKGMLLRVSPVPLRPTTSP